MHKQFDDMINEMNDDFGNLPFRQVYVYEFLPNVKILNIYQENLAEEIEIFYD